MKRCLFVSLILLFLSPVITGADDFLGAPLIPGARIIKKTDTHLTMEVEMSHDQALDFYKKALKDEKDIKIREWKEMSYIEDDGARPWHAISIPKVQGNKIIIKVKKDSWSWIISTLIIRYIGVFVVLMVIFLSISLSGKLISGAVRRMEEKKKAA